MFYIMARVSGGVTGTRESILKDVNGSPKYFDSKEDAQKEASHWNKERNTSYSVRFHYWVEGE